ncbi:conserved hypothetical protein [Candidatus Protochlamydia naegleriophila]|uniref:Terminase n=1 Tax=Candidatus Protochlamydia naegleriophila TaxID=389348 RepID=A0A0U5JEP1_9BACT|nr:hypothetical protein [Candidatus Protochlamydia naegleriophila]CUI17982.1 conserved hypothetical protein [Candidatus Protochlamydia naegleriophila]
MNNNLGLAEKRILDPHWRLSNLYWIIDKESNKILFKMNWAQEELYRNLWYCSIILKARQLGISTFVSLLFLDRCLFNSNCSAGIIAHTKEDAEMLFRRVKLAYENLPEELKALRTVNMDNARELQFNNGSLLRVGTSMRGSTLQYLHISEFGKICAKYPDKAREIITGSLNALAPGQYIIIESTAEGRDGYFYEMCKQAQALKDSEHPLSKLDYRFFFFPWWKHPDYEIHPETIPIVQDLQEYFRHLQDNEKITLSLHQKAWYAKKHVTQGLDMRREYPSTPDESFAVSNEGLYYGSLITKVRLEKRIRKIYYDENVPVNTAWDLGYGDSTVIWFFQVCGQEIHLLDYYENSGEALTHYLKYIKNKPYSYLKHFVPHDAGAHEYSTGMTRIEVARNHGIEFILAPKVSVAEGIDAVRNILNRCWFDEEKCAKGIKMLESYKREWDDRNGCWKENPLHNFASHGADAFRILALSLGLAKQGMTAEDVRELRERALTGSHRYSPTSSLPPLNPFGNLRSF